MKTQIEKIIIITLSALLLSTSAIAHVNIDSTKDILIEYTQCINSNHLNDNNPNTIYTCGIYFINFDIEIITPIFTNGLNSLVLSMAQSSPEEEYYASIKYSSSTATETNVYSIYDGNITTVNNILKFPFSIPAQYSNEKINIELYKSDQTPIEIKDLFIAHIDDDLTDIISGIVTEDVVPDDVVSDDVVSDDVVSDDVVSEDVVKNTTRYSVFLMPFNTVNPTTAQSPVIISDDCSDGSLDSSTVALLNNDFIGSPMNGDSNFWCSLKDLYIYSNTSSVVISSNILALTGLEQIRVSDQGINSLPNEICDLPNLTQIQLSKNNLTSIPNCIGNLVNLTYLNLDDNKLITLPTSIKQLINLRELHLSQNYNFSSFPSNMSQLINLDYLYANDTNLLTLPIEFADLSLYGLSVSNSNLHSVPIEIFNKGFQNFNYTGNPNIIFE